MQYPSRVQTTKRAIIGLAAVAVSCCLIRSTEAFVPMPPSHPIASTATPLSSRRIHTCKGRKIIAMSILEPPNDTSTSEGTTGGAGGGLAEVLARKAKQKEVEAFKAALPRAHPIFTELEKVGSYERSIKVYEALRHRYGNTLTVVAEYYRKAPWALLGSVLEPKEYSSIYREAGASVIAVNVDPLTGGCSHEDIKQMADEQALAEGEDVNAPVPIIAADVVVDPIQISRAKLAGASGITLRYGLNPPEVTKELIQTTLGLGMEPLVQVRTAEEAHEVTAIGGKLFFLIGNTRSQGLALRQDMPDNAMIGFDLRRPREYQYGLNEVEDAWILRDADFHSVYVSNLLWQTPLDDVVGPSAVIKALRAKACHFMVDPLDWIEKSVSEGTKETLGELLV